MKPRLAQRQQKMKSQWEQRERQLFASTEAHRQYCRKYNRERHDELVEMKLCLRCKQPRGDLLHCDDCTEKERLRRVQRRQKDLRGTTTRNREISFTGGPGVESR